MHLEIIFLIKLEIIFLVKLDIEILNKHFNNKNRREIMMLFNFYHLF